MNDVERIIAGAAMKLMDAYPESATVYVTEHDLPGPERAIYIEAHQDGWAVTVLPVEAAQARVDAMREEVEA